MAHPDGRLEIAGIASMLGTETHISPRGTIFFVAEDNRGALVSVQVEQATPAVTMYDIGITGQGGVLLLNPRVTIDPEGGINIEDGRSTFKLDPALNATITHHEE